MPIDRRYCIKMTSVRTVEYLARASGIAFGTSGARGLATAFTDDVCHGYTIGFLRHLMDQDAWRPGNEVALAGDLRPSTPRILAACIAAITALGGVPKYCGNVPTPALALYSMGRQIPAIMVTGSHIPEDRNGIKFYRPEGEILKEDELGILAQPLANDLAIGTECSELPPIHDVLSAYKARYLNAFGSNALSGRRLGVYQHSAVGRDVLVDIFEALGATVLALGRSERFVPVDTEAVREEDHVLARQWAREHSLDAIASTDGDSDRPLLADQQGEWLRGDVLGVLCARELGLGVVVTPVSSNSIAERSGAFSRVERTRIGSPYVIKAMNDALADGEPLVCGYEANGGFLLANDVTLAKGKLAALPTRDAMLPIIAALIASGDGSLRQLLGELPQRFTSSDRLPDFAPERKDALMEWLQRIDQQTSRLEASFGDLAQAPLAALDLTDGVRMTFANDRVIHLRGSGNAPEMRCYAEAESPQLAGELSSKSLAFVAGHFPE